ncbi:MAG: FAD-dependent oxidoreductase [Candidatus Berkelbacteria bacterium]|nr:FAD-dependent oxidoreductase [Candidatus Berkelbacteria bacterium]MCR4307337.1 FAD-dependent oxidoreductase [Candidatus Berkelbacteria bacterium]
MGRVAGKHRVVIVGGGFGGIRASQELAKYSDEFDITLVSDKSHFEYHAALYRVVTGRSPLEVCIPLSTIFESSPVNVVEDTIQTVYPKTKQILGKDGSKYSYDSLILALGSENAYLNVPGLKEHSFTLRSINDALRLKEHIHEIFINAAISLKNGTRQPIHIVLVGGGPTGVELSGELAIYARHMARRHRLDPNTIIIDLFESGERLLGTLDKKISEIAFERLHYLGVNIFLNTPILENRIEAAYLADMKLKTKTLIWTAGVTTNPLYARIKGLSFNATNKVLVDLSMQAKGFHDLYVIGDAAASMYSGMAQSALYDGEFVAECLRRKLHGRPIATYNPHKPIFAIPVGLGWAIVVTKIGVFRGKLGWILRRAADFRFFSSILPLQKALIAFSDGYQLSETCPICSKPNRLHSKV